MTGSHSVTSHNRSHDRNGKVVHRPSSSCISSVENLTGTLLSSFCQMLIKSSWLNSGLELTLWHLPSYVSDSTVNPFQHTRYLSFPLPCYDLAKQLSHYLYFFSFLFLLSWTYYIEGSVGKGHVTSVTVTWQEVTASHDRSHDRHGKIVHRPCNSCISSVENLTGTLLSSLCQSLNKEQLALFWLGV